MCSVGEVTILWLSLQLNINVGELQNKVRSRISSSCCEVRGDVQQNKKKKSLFTVDKSLARAVKIKID